MILGGWVKTEAGLRTTLRRPKMTAKMMLFHSHIESLELEGSDTRHLNTSGDLNSGKI